MNVNLVNDWSELEKRNVCFKTLLTENNEQIILKRCALKKSEFRDVRRVFAIQDTGLNDTTFTG